MHKKMPVDERNMNAVFFEMVRGRRAGCGWEQSCIFSLWRRTQTIAPHVSEEGAFRYIAHLLRYIDYLLQNLELILKKYGY